jgi:DNA-binding Lrp family transcriptional regulator
MSDIIDQKILLALRENGRASNIEIARQVGISVATVAKRVEGLLANNIITITAVLNPYKLGYKAHAFITLDIDLNKVHDVCDTLVKNPYISFVATSFGRFDVLLIIDCPTWEIVHAFVKEELSQIDGIIKVETFLVSDVIKRYNGIFTEDVNNVTPVTLDETDIRLIEALMKDGRTHYSDLSNILGVSIGTIARRIAVLTKEDIIKIIAVPNPSKLGYVANANLALNVERDKIKSVSLELSKYSPVYMVLTLINGFEILAGVDSPNPESLHKFITEKIANIKGVSNIETFIRAEIIKANYARLEFGPKA